MRGLSFACALLGLGLGLTATAPLAQEKPGERAGRYTMTPADGGFVRLDTETGAMALCNKSSGQWACEPMPDTQQAQSKDLQRLEAENKALREEIRQMEEVMGLGQPKPGEGGPRHGEERPKGGMGLPSEKDVDQAFDYVQRMLKKFQEKMRELESGQKSGDKSGTPL